MSLRYIRFHVLETTLFLRGISSVLSLITVVLFGIALPLAYISAGELHTEAEKLQLYDHLEQEHFSTTVSSPERGKTKYP